MSLYLAGNTKENSIAFASDGRVASKESANPKSTNHSVVQEGCKKFDVISPDFVICGSGLAQTIHDVTFFLKDFYEQSLRISSTNAGYSTVMDFQNYKDLLSKGLRQARDSHKKEGGLDVYHTQGKIHIFGLSKDGKSAYALILTNLENGVIGYETQDTEMQFPIRTGGIHMVVNGILFEYLANGGSLSKTENEMLGLFSYLLEATAEKELGVGGQFYFAVMGKNGVREISSDDTLEIDMRAEEARQSLEGLTLVHWSDIKGHLSPIRLLALTNYDTRGIANMALDRLDEYETDGDSEYIADAVELSRFGMNEKLIFDAVAKSIMGRAYLLSGNVKEARALFEDIADELEDKYEGEESGEAHIRALKGLVRIDKAKYMPRFSKTANMLLGFAFTREQIKAIK